MDEESESFCIKAQNDIIELAIPQHLPLTQRFAPRDSLYTYLSSGEPPAVVAYQILECPCSNCAKYRRGIPHSRSPKEKLKAILGFDGSTSPPRKGAQSGRSALVLFSLLVAIGYPGLITVLLNQNLDDSLLQRSLDDVLASLTNPEKWQWMRGYVPVIFHFTAVLDRYLPMFAIPHFDNNHYVEFNAKTILPFINEERLGRTGSDGHIVNEGGSSSVYKFTIYDCYNQLGEHGEFVRKELTDDVPLQKLAEQFGSEANALQTVDELQSPNIVKLIKTYKHGHRFNIIFRKEKSDLNHYLRDDCWQLEAESLRKGPLETCELWRHALGITEALGQISRIPDPMAPYTSDARERVLNGFHFDLKPGNILVSDETWLISDFGIARFQQAVDGATSRVISMGGTDAYAPPEMLNITDTFSRRYDVWSLGCILLEVTAHAVAGRKALLELDKARCSKSGRITDNRFYCHINHPGVPFRFQVKPAVTRFMNLLKREEKATGQTAASFLHDILELIGKMLQPDVEHRIDIREVVPELKRIVASQQVPETPRKLYPEPSPEDNEENVTPEPLQDMKLYHYTSDGMTRGSRQLVLAQLHTFRRNKDTLRVVVADPTQREKPTSIQLSEPTGRIVPVGMFERHDRVAFEDINSGSIFDSTFEFMNSSDADYFQSHMIHQGISRRYRFQNLEVERRSAFSMSRLFANKDASDFDEPLGFSTGQLWVESTEAFNRATAARRTRPQDHDIPVRRLIIFSGQVGNNDNPPKIISIIITGAIRYLMEHQRPRDLDPNKTRFVPNKPSNDKYISVAVIRPLAIDDETRKMPSIPLNITSFRKEEEKDKFDCKKLELTFADEDARKKFERDFNRFHRERHEARALAEEERQGTRKPQSRSSNGRDSYLHQLQVPSSSGSSRHSREKGKERADFEIIPDISGMNLREQRSIFDRPFGHRRGQ